MRESLYLSSQCIYSLMPIDIHKIEGQLQSEFNPIQARGDPPKVFVHNSQGFWDNSLKFGDFS